MTNPAEGEKETARLLAFWTNIVADWADRMPLRNVYILATTPAARRNRPAN